MISARAIRNSPDLQKKMNIEKNDERNILLANTAKGKAFDMMTYVFGALMVSFALMEVDWTAILLLVFAYIFVFQRSQKCSLHPVNFMLKAQTVIY